MDVETGGEKPWLLKNVWKTCATYYDPHVPQSSIETLGHSVGGVTYRHDAHRDPLANKAIMTIPQPIAFTGLVKGIRRPMPLPPAAISGRLLKTKTEFQRSFPASGPHTVAVFR